MDQSAQDKVVFSIRTQIDRTAGIGHPNIFAGFALTGPAMIGVMRADDSVGGRWERHDGGDELLVLMAGRCTITVRRSDGRQTAHDAERGDVLLIPKGAAHSFTLHTPEVHLLFVTPREGNSTWNGEADGDPSLAELRA
jgi:mannose-6-phosphate isomerase-like protein (cupin superfamily)